MDEMQILDLFGAVNEKLDTIIAQTAKKPQSPFGTPGEAPPSADTLKPWEITLKERKWTPKKFAEQIKQREAMKVNCWSLAGGASQEVVDMIAAFKADNTGLFPK